jgi:alpha-ketoglutarate-dependent taurine dioxygenase
MPLVSALLRHRRVCLYLWERGEVLVNDNVAMLNTRTIFSSNCDRNLRRIHAHKKEPWKNKL